MSDQKQLNNPNPRTPAQIRIDHGGLIRAINAEALALFGYSEDELLGRPVDELVPDRFKGVHPDHRAAFLKNPRPGRKGLHKCLWGRKKGGQEFPVEINLSIKEGDKELEIVCEIQAISPSLTPEAQLSVQQAALDAATEAILVADADGHVRWVNAAFTALTGYAPDEVLGQHAGILYSGEKGPEFFDGIWVRVLRGESWKGTIDNRRKNGELYTEEMTISLTHDEDGALEHIVVVKREVSDASSLSTAGRSLFAQERARREQAEGLIEVAAEVNKSLDVETILDGLLDQVEKLIPFDSASIMLIEENRVRIVRHRGYEKYSAAIARQIAGQTFDLRSTESFREMYQLDRPLIISDTRRYPGWVKTEAGLHILSWAGAPMSARGEVLGFLSLDKTETGFYRPEHLKTLTAIASQAAMALQNARLFDQEHRRLNELQALRATLMDISAELELPRLLRDVLDRASSLVGAAGGELGLYREESREIDVVVSRYIGRDLAGTRLAFGEGAMGWVAKTRDSLVLEDYASWEGRSGKYADVPIRALMAAPMLVGNRLIGVISIADPDEDKIFSQSDLNLLNMFAHQAAIAVDNARLFESARERAEEAETLRLAGAVVAASLEQQKAIERILDQLHRVLPYDGASVQLLREGYVEIVGGRGWPDAEAILGVRFPIPGDNPNTKVIQDRKPVILDNVDFTHSSHGLRIRSWLGVPLIVRNRVIGMLAIDSLEPYHFIEKHARLVTAFADQVALALENARYFEAERRRVEELGVMNAIAVVGAEATNVDELIRGATGIVRDTLRPDVFGIMLLDESRNALVSHASYHMPRDGDEPARVTVPVGEGVTGRVAATGEPLRIGDVGQQEGYLAHFPDTRSELCVPLRIGDRVEGVINAESRARDAFSEEDERLLQILAGQLATALDKVRLYEEAVSAAERRAVLYRASQEIGASLQPEQIHAAIHRAAEELMPCEVFVIAMYEPGSAEVEVPYLYERGERFEARRVSLDKSLSGYVVRNDRSIRTGDFERTHSGEVQAEIFGETGNEHISLLAVPMRLGSQVVGMLSSQAFTANAYTEEDQESLELLAVQAAVALNNAKLFLETRHQLDELLVLNAFAEAVAIADSEDLLIEQATQLIQSALYPENIGVLLLDPEANVLRIHTSYRGLERALSPDQPEIEIKLGQGVSGRVAVEGMPVRLADVTLETAYIGLDPRIRSELCVPMKVGDRVIGVINAESAAVNAFRAADERFLMTFANQLATALEKLRLFDEVQQLAITDPLTGQYNRRHFYSVADREFQRARRYRRPLALIMIDLDRFKTVNDTFGHAVGDRVLQVVARRCHRSLRSIDVFGRYGGEEFVALLPESQIEGARFAAERLCTEIGERPIQVEQHEIRITISLGVAGFSDDVENLDELLRRADRALYDAKQQGRNRACIFPGASDPPDA